MPIVYNYEEFLRYLSELESALLLSAQQNCNGLRTDTQTSAAIYALVRATSLFRASLLLLDAGLLDACDVVRRACWEAWMLGYEFRILGAGPHAARWHTDKHRHSEADIKRIKAFEASCGLAAAQYGADYGGLSEVSHPTKSAAENSIVTVTTLRGNPDSKAHRDQGREILAHEDAPGMMYLLIWTVLAESPDMITLGITPEAIPSAASFVHEYETQNPSTPTS